jgi:hypothetical protein
MSELRSLGNRFISCWSLPTCPDIAELYEHQTEVQFLEDGKSHAQFAT